jgi:hypothetical protein
MREMFVDSLDSVESHCPFLLIQIVEQVIVNSFEHSSNNTQLDPKKDLMFVIILGYGKCKTASILLGSGLVPSLLTT